MLVTGRPAGWPVGVSGCGSGVAVEPRERAATPDGNSRKLADHSLRNGGCHLDDAERVAHINAPDVGLGEAQLADQRPDQILRARPIFLPDVYEPLDPPSGGWGRRGRFTFPACRFPPQSRTRALHL